MSVVRTPFKSSKFFVRLGFCGVSVVVVGFLYDFLTMRDVRLISFMSSQTKRSPTSVFKMNRKNAAMRCPIASERSMISSHNSRFCVSCTLKVTPRFVLKSEVLREICRFPLVMRLHQLASIFRVHFVDRVQLDPVTDWVDRRSVFSG